MTDSEILAALRAGGSAREKAWEYMYKKWRGIWLRKIFDSGGTSDEGDEALNDVCLSFENAATSSGFELKTASLRTYLTSCVYYRWLYNKGKEPRTEEFEEGHIRGFAESVDVAIFSQECRDLLDTLLLAALGERCKTILLMHAERYKMEEIATAMGFQGGADTAKKERYKCTQKMVQFLQTNPDFNTRYSDC